MKTLFPSFPASFRRFVTGILLGVCVIGNPAALSARMVARPTEVVFAPPPCEDLTQYPTNCQPFVQTQCTVEQMTFGDELAPSTGFRLSEQPTKAGHFAVTDAYGRELKLEVVQSIAIPLRKSFPETFAEGDEGYVLTGWLRGDTGSVPVQMITLAASALSPDEPDLKIAFVVSVLSDAQVEQASHAQRILAGARVVDSATGRSVPLSAASASMSLYSFPSDLSTLYGQEVPVEEPHADKSCIDLAYRRYALAQKTAERIMADCVAVAMLRFVTCMGLAQLTLLAGPSAPLLFALAAAGCLADQVYNMATCLSGFNAATELNTQNLLLDLEACGVTVTPT